MGVVGWGEGGGVVWIEGGINLIHTPSPQVIKFS